MKPPAILLIRHGESQANADLPTASPSAIALTEKGHAQAAALAESIATEPDLIVVSPFLRTQQTAAPLTRKFPVVPVETWPVHEFTYLDITRHAGTTEAGRAAAVHDYWQRCDPHWIDGAGAESFAGFIERVDDMLERLSHHPSKRIHIFTHGYFMLATHARLDDPRAKIDAAWMARFRDHLKPSPPAHTEVWPVEQIKTAPSTQTP